MKNRNVSVSLAGHLQNFGQNHAMRMLIPVSTFCAGILVGSVSLYFGFRADGLLHKQTSRASLPPAPVAPAVLRPAADDDFHVLSRHTLAPPISSIQADNLRDSFTNLRPGRKTHEAIDIPAPRGTPIHALDDGVISRLTVGEKGGISIYETDRSSDYCYYYAHLSRYANRLHRGMAVRHGDIIGYVGTTGDARPNGPHLHLSITRIGPDGHWWEGAPVNPYPILVAICRDARNNTN